MDPVLIAFGFGVGVLVGLTGMGGGSLMTPLLILVLGVKPIIAVGTDIAYAAVTKGVGGLAHVRRGTVDVRLALWIAVGSVPSATAGVVLLKLLERAYGPNFDGIVLGIVGAALILSALAVLGRALLVARATIVERERAVLGVRGRVLAIAIGAGVGFVLGVSSAGSGPLVAVALILLFRLRPARVVGTDVFHAAVLLCPVAVAHAVAGNVDYGMGATILVGSVPGVLLGSAWCVRLPVAALRSSLGVVMLVSGTALLARAGLPIPAPALAATAAALALILAGRPAMRRLVPAARVAAAAQAAAVQAPRETHVPRPSAGAYRSEGTVRRLLIYSQDGMGLGHLRRTSSVACEIVRREPDCGVLIVSDSPATPPFDQIAGVDYLKLPTIVKTGRSSWRNGTLPMDVERVIALRAKLILEAYRAFRPDTVLIDHMPVGALGELKPMLNRIAVSRRRPKLFLSLRDIIDDPAVVRAVWTRLGAYDYLRSYDAVLIFGCKEIYDADAAYGLSPVAARVVFCNYALRELPEAPWSPRADDPLLLVMGGGGGDAFLLEETFLQALPMVPDGVDQRAVILTGPNMPRLERDALLARSASHRIRVERGVQDSTDWLLRTSTVLMMGGYNSLCEALGARKRALVVPRRGPSAEQRMRSRLFAERRLIRTLEPRDLTPDALAAELTSLFDDDGIPDLAALPPMDGAQRASDLLCGWSRAGGARSRPRRPASRAEVA